MIPPAVVKHEIDKVINSIVFRSYNATEHKSQTFENGLIITVKIASRHPRKDKNNPKNYYTLRARDANSEQGALAYRYKCISTLKQEGTGFHNSTYLYGDLHSTYGYAISESWDKTEPGEQETFHSHYIYGDNYSPSRFKTIVL